MIRAVLFDLDDTLYPERQYKESGLRAAAEWLGGPEETYRRLKEWDKGGRPLSELTEKLVEVYRSHPPKIEVYSDVLPCLDALKKKGILIGLVSNNATGAQDLKLDALRIRSFFDVIILAKDPDLKPSPAPFQEALKRLNIPSEEAVFAGNHPEWDIAPAKRLGLKTVLIKRPDALLIPLLSSADEKVNPLVADAVMADLSDFSSWLDGQKR